MLESSIEQRSRTEAEKLGCSLVKLTALTGLPDRLLLVPGGRLAFLEFKRPGKELRPIQQWWFRKLTAMGFRCERVDSVERVLEIIKELSNG